MKIKAAIFPLLCLLVFCLCGCSVDDTGDVKINSSKADISLDFSNDVEIYEITREVFSEFLENNKGEYIKANASRCHKYSEDGSTYQTSAVNLWRISDDFINLTESKAEMQKYLAENGISGDVEGLVIFDAHHIPLTVWVKLSTETVFITIGEDPLSTERGTYILYNRDEYREKFKAVKARLSLNGLDITDGRKVDVYYGYADLPFTKICSSLGAKVKWKDKTRATINFNERIYELNADENILREKNADSNLLNYITGGGPYYMYLSDREYYLNSGTLRVVLKEMGKDITYKYDKENGIFNVTEK